jgi:hypothetical protein
VTLYPIYHPAAALYTPSMLKVLEEDFARIPGLLERTLEAPAPAPAPAVGPAVEPVPQSSDEPDPESVQLGLF